MSSKALAGAAVVMALATATPAAAQTGLIVERMVPTPGSEPIAVVTGPDGNLWFTEFTGNKIARMTPSGQTAEFPIPTANSQPDGIDVGPDGNLWFAEVAGNRIGRITPTGQITEFFVGGNRPTVIAPGPDGKLWFTERGSAANPGSHVGSITTDGEIRRYPVPTPGSRPLGITGGPDGNVWFTEQIGNRIGRLDPATGQIVEFPLPRPNSQPWEITAGPDGNLWFAEFAGNRIGRITPSGEIDEFAVPTPASGPNTIRRGPDPHAAANCTFQRATLGDNAFALRYGRFGGCVSQLARTETLWFTESLANNVAQVTTGGDMFEYAIPTPESFPIGITQGPDGAVWFAETDANKIGRLEIRSVRRPAPPGARAARLNLK